MYSMFSNQFNFCCCECIECIVSDSSLRVSKFCSAETGMCSTNSNCHDQKGGRNRRSYSEAGGCTPRQRNLGVNQGAVRGEWPW
ncbi:hypothetical protein pipiens_002618 [Culex pipiens pipiens]|uniref:Uncharacterized protein n=1 Tax=Culex pipiens pipiens TaxID=38569 RepID=A0ABD1DAM4_CULPP